MQRIKWTALLALGLLTTSMVIYTMHYLVFGDLKFITRGGFASLAFVPIQGLVVTLIIAELMVIMNRGSRMQKMNMVIGAFFSELGTRLLHHFYVGDPNGQRLREVFEKADDLSSRQVQAILQQVADYQFISDLGTDDLIEELDARDDLTRSPKSDVEHLKGDVTRAYRCLFVEWVHYMRHLHDNYPFLFSFAMRTNPLEQEKQVEVV